MYELNVEAFIVIGLSVLDVYLMWQNKHLYIVNIFYVTLNLNYID